jgi:hypothetical protein
MPMNAIATSTLEDRVRQIRSEIDAIVDARAEAVAKQSPGVPLGVIRNLLTARAGVCRCAQYLELVSDGSRRQGQA